MQDNRDELNIPHTVTSRVNDVKQPRGGYINPKDMTLTCFDDNMCNLYAEENISPNLIGLAVDYLTRIMTGESPDEAFFISLSGAKIIGEERKALKLCKIYVNVKKNMLIPDEYIINAIKLSGYDSIVRAGIYTTPVQSLNPDERTIQNVRTMVKRSIKFFQNYGPKTCDGFTFEGGYTRTIVAGDGDFLTKDTLWDFKVSKYPVTKNHTLQILIYWLMGIHSIHPEFLDIKYIGIYNPRRNEVSRIAINDIPTSIIREVEKNVIGY